MMKNFDLPQIVLVMPIVGVLSFISLRKKAWFVPIGTIILSIAFQIVAGEGNSIKELYTDTQGIAAVLLYVLPILLLFQILGMVGGICIRVLINRKKPIILGVILAVVGVAVTILPYLYLFGNPLKPITARRELTTYAETHFDDYAISEIIVYFDMNTSDYKCRTVMADGAIRIACYDESGQVVTESGEEKKQTADEPTLQNESVKQEAPTDDGFEVLDSVKSEYVDGVRYIFEMKQEKEASSEDMGRIRELVVRREYEDGQNELIAKNENAALNEKEGGVWGDPYKSMKVKGDKFILTFYGGSAWRWTQKYTFKIKKNGIVLIKAYYDFFNVSDDMLNTPGSFVEEENYQTGKVKRQENVGDKVEKTVKEMTKEAPSISEFNVYE